MSAIGLKLLRSDYSSLRAAGRVVYGTRWQEIGGVGAFVAVTDGLDSAGRGALCAALECRDPTDFQDCPTGVQTFRRVRRLPSIPWERMTPDLLGMFAAYAPGASVEDIDRCLAGTTPEWLGRIAQVRWAELSAAQRQRCIDGTTPAWRGEIAHERWNELTAAQLERCIDGTTPGWRGHIAQIVWEELNPAQRERCLAGTTPYWLGHLGYTYWAELTAAQRQRCIDGTTPDLRGEITRRWCRKD